MHNLNEDVEKIMQLLGELSERAKRLGSDSTYYAANRAWTELYERNSTARAQQESKDA